MATILILLIVCAGIILGGAFYAYRIAFFSPKENRDRIPEVHGPNYDPYKKEMARIFKQLNDRSFERVYITSFDGLKLTGRYYHVKDGAPLDIGFHGYRSNPLTDFSGGSELSFQLEHNLLLIEERAHCQSQGKTITFGIKERQDLLHWVDYAIERFGDTVQIFLYGVSMGGATVLMASELNLPENVKAIIADCPYSSPTEVILHVGKTKAFPQWLIKPFAILGAKIYGGFDLQETTAAEAVKLTKVPILIIHGENDGYVPCEMSNIVASNPDMIERHVFPRADHGISYLVDTPRYHRVVKDFLAKII